MIENFGNNLARLRKRNKMKQSDLAERLGVSKQTISKIESGRGYPTFDNLEKISQIFNASPIELFGTEKERAVADTPKILKEIDKYDNKVENLFAIQAFLEDLEADDSRKADIFYRICNMFWKRALNVDEYGFVEGDEEIRYSKSMYEQLLDLLYSDQVAQMLYDIQQIDFKKITKAYNELQYLKNNTI